MSRTRRPDAEGDLLVRLSPEQHDAHLSPRGGVPRTGATVHLWRLPGTWSVWSPGPETGTWWLQPVDHKATALGLLLEEKSSRGAPVVVRTWHGSIAVRSRDIRPWGR